MNRKHLRIINNIFIYVSLSFLIIFLAKKNYFDLPNVSSYFFLIVAIILVICGMLGNAFAWQRILALNNYKVTYKDSLISMGISVFGKYIPGKFWMILGRSSYISEKYGYPLGKISSISFFAQLISIWAGLVIGISGIMIDIDIPIWMIILSFSFVMLLLLFITPIFQKIILPKAVPIRILNKIIIEDISLKQFVKASPYFAISWVLYLLGFYYFSIGIIDDSFNFVMAFTFPLAASFGILTFFAPGGLGVREGLLFALLVASGLFQKDATTISVTSRLWFLIGETFIFILAVILNWDRRK